MRAILLSIVGGLLLGAGAAILIYPKFSECGKNVSQKENVSEAQTITKIVSEKRTNPDKSSSTSTTTTIVRRKKEKEKQEDMVIPPKAQAKWSLGLHTKPTLTPSEVRIEDVTIGRRLGDTPIWGEVGFTIDKKNVHIGLRLEF